MMIFSPVGATISVSATITSSSTALTAIESTGRASKSVRIYNSGTVVVFIAFGISTITATTASLPIPPGGVEVFEVSPKATHVAGITAAGSATLYATTGRGG